MPGRIDGLILRSSPSARGVWFVGWSKTVGGGGLWWEAIRVWIGLCWWSGELGNETCGQMRTW
jgi:hypothetical protein